MSTKSKASAEETMEKVRELSAIWNEQSNSQMKAAYKIEQQKLFQRRADELWYEIAPFLEQMYKEIEELKGKNRRMHEASCVVAGRNQVLKEENEEIRELNRGLVDTVANTVGLDKVKMYEALKAVLHDLPNIEDATYEILVTALCAQCEEALSQKSQ